MAADKLARAYVNCSSHLRNVYCIVIGSVKVLLSGATCWRLAHSRERWLGIMRRQKVGNRFTEMCCSQFGPGIVPVFI